MQQSMRSGDWDLGAVVASGWVGGRVSWLLVSGLGWAGLLGGGLRVGGCAGVGGLGEEGRCEGKLGKGVW